MEYNNFSPFVIQLPLRTFTFTFFCSFGLNDGADCCHVLVLGAAIISSTLLFIYIHYFIRLPSCQSSFFCSFGLNDGADCCHVLVLGAAIISSTLLCI